MSTDMLRRLTNRRFIIIIISLYFRIISRCLVTIYEKLNAKHRHENVLRKRDIHCTFQIYIFKSV